MLRRFSINFALLSMLMDALIVVGAMWLSGAIRPILNQIPFIKTLPPGDAWPLTVFFLFPAITVLVFGTFSL